MTPMPVSAVDQISKAIQRRIEEIAEQEINLARERMKDRIPEIAAEIGIRLQQALSEGHNDAVLQIVIRPNLGR